MGVLRAQSERSEDKLFSNVGINNAEGIARLERAYLERGLLDESPGPAARRDGPGNVRDAAELAQVKREKLPAVRGRMERAL